jgi:hypothetical protein
VEDHDGWAAAANLKPLTPVGAIALPPVPQQIES